MPRLLVLVVTAFALLSGAAAAADIPGQSPIGEVFAEPVYKGRRGAELRVVKPVREPIVTYAPEVFVPSIVRGYYGKPHSYYYYSYYGSPPEMIFDRAPYACNYYGYC